jgi:uroporphyrinogen decarboxylase
LLEDAVYAPVRRLLRFLQHKFPHIPVICFPKGIGEKLPLYLQTTGATALSIDYHVDLSLLLPQIPSHIILQGALDPQVLVVGGKTLEQEISRLKKSLAGHPYIFNLGHGIVPETPHEHVTQLIHILHHQE